ncbi:MAG: hypothetical protein ACXABY_33600, partial [Candidatus Thorarchaeota archaeon]
RGLNKEKEFNLLGPEWATEATNCVISRGGRIASRKGWADQTTNPITGTKTIDVLHEYINKAGTQTMICVADNKIYKDIDDFTDAANLIPSTTTPTADNWQFINFNGKVIGFQIGHAPIEWSGSSVFTDQSYTGTGPDGNCAVGAFGRVWAADADLQTIRYSVLLDDTDYSAGNGGGTIDMSSVWTNGMDQITAIAALGSNLLVFGKRHIVIWADGTGSEIGIDPTNMYVADTIEGTGCIARDSIQAIGEGDLFFLSRHGVQSLKRVIADKNNPITSVTKSIKGLLAGYLVTERAASANLIAVRSVHSPENSLYLLLLPTLDIMIAVDTRQPFEDEDGDMVYPITTWEVGGTIRSLVSRENGDLLLGSSGVVGKYSGDLDDTSSYDMNFWSAWLDLGQLNERLKMLKEFSAIIQIGGTGSATYKWEFDFLGDSSSKTIAYSAPTGAEYNVAEYSIGEYSGTLTIQRKSFPGVGQGQFIRVGASIAINNFNFVIQQLQLIPAVGRLVA